MPKNNWTPIALTPLSGMLDSRSQPADLAPGSFRYKLNASINRTGSLCTQAGHAALNFGLRSDDPTLVANWDFHRRGTASRTPITFLFENTSPTGVRTLFAGSDSELSRLDSNTSEWTALSPGGTGKRWRAAALEDIIIFTNAGANGLQSGVLSHDIGTNGFNAPHPIISSTRGALMIAKVAITFSDVVLLMNVMEGVDRISSRVVWSDYKIGYDFEVKTASVAGFQDLDYGDAILNAVEMAGALYIFCERSIWRCVTNISADTIFSFQKIYSEPKNQSGCLVYANSLVTNGRELYWLGRDTIWTFNQYIVAPESPDWLLRGSGVLFSEANPDRIDKRCCDAIIGEYRPLTKEVWFSYPQDNDLDDPTCINNRCLVLNAEFKTMNLTDHGYSAFVNNRLTPGTGEACNADHIFIGASGADYCLKSIGDVYRRDMVSSFGGSVLNDIPDVAYTVTPTGYFVRIIGAIPVGFKNQLKTVRELLIDAEIIPNALVDQNLLTLRIGNSFSLQDPVSTNAYCAVQWHDQESFTLACPDSTTLAAMAAEGQNPSDSLAFNLWEQGNYLYYDLRITSADGVSAPVEHGIAMSAFRFDIQI